MHTNTDRAVYAAFGKLEEHLDRMLHPDVKDILLREVGQARMWYTISQPAQSLKVLRACMAAAPSHEERAQFAHVAKLVQREV